MSCTYKQHYISDKNWALLEPYLPGRKGMWGGVATDNRQFINAVFWILRNEAPWRDLPQSYGSWNNTQRRFCRWRDKGIWEKLLEQLILQPDYEWLLIGTNHIKTDNKGMKHTKGAQTPRCIWPWMRLICRSELLLNKLPAQIAHKYHSVETLTSSPPSSLR